MLVHRFLEDSARRAPDTAALIEPGRTISYDHLNRAANRFAQLFGSTGVVRGDRIVIALDNGLEFAAAYLGGLKAGAIVVPLAAGARNDRLSHAIADCSPRVCVIDAATALETASNGFSSVRSVYVQGSSANLPNARFQILEQSLAECPEQALSVRCIDQDLAAIIYTSGSTGEPRGVMLTHRNFVTNARSIVSYLELTSADRIMCVLPFHYVYGLSLLHTHLAVGGSLVIENRSAFPNVVLAGMKEHQVTGFAGVPSTFAIMMHRSNLEEARLPHLRYVTQAGGSMPPSRITEWLERGPAAKFYVMYGATEAAARLTYLPPADLKQRMGSVGKPIPNVEIQVITETGERAAPGEIGELVARGSNISCGYWNNQEETRQRFGPLGFRTGDLGYADEEGYLFLVGRQQDMIKVGAHRVGAKEIEDVLHNHPAVREAAVVAVEHPLLGEAPVAFVSLRQELTMAPTALRAFCATRLPTHKIPLRVAIQPELPKLSGSGKVDKLSLRRLASTLVPETARPDDR